TKLKQSENLALNYQPVESTSNPSPQGTVSYFQIILLHDVITFCGLNVFPKTRMLKLNDPVCSG
ncbi:hypothetical protein ACQP3C_31365, partial [Escherichia coli]